MISYKSTYILIISIKYVMFTERLNNITLCNAMHVKLRIIIIKP